MREATAEELAAFEHFGLRQYQIEAVLRVSDAYRNGARNVLLCAPTAAGKTRISACVAYLASNNGKHSHFVVDRENLVDQTSRTFDQFGVSHGIVKQNHWRYRPYERAQILSIQTVMRRGWPDDPKPKFIIVDECHTVHAPTKDRLAAGDARGLGLTATPFTKGLGQIYDTLINVETTNRLIEQGALVPFRIFSPSKPNMDGVKVNVGEWEQKEAAKRALEVVGDCVAEYLKHGNNQKFICSAITVDHAREIHRQFTAAGIQCVVYTSRETDSECDEIVSEFSKADSFIRGLITVSKATKGFDVPDVGCVIMCRPLRKSLADHIQLLGRGLRTSPGTGKTECIVLDHSGNCERFWDEMNEFFETGAIELDDGKKKPKAEKKTPKAEDAMVKCPHCATLHKARPACPSCGHEYPIRKTVQHVEGTLQELLASGNQRQLLTDVWPMVCQFARLKSDDEERARRKAYAMYKELTGTMAKADFFATIPVLPTPEVARRLVNAEKRYWIKWRAEKRKAA
ncbi:DEAD/DEAH box helicase [Paraburkholderia strydomiana]|uniref:DEAD/DEAH box helicase n=1 Tax=Paraburkholderia strydomiana TaxID=1245417 RepID=UPI0028646095|nr:DEAD/DEAH box helicase family protein [Paraburkholderia strydomiana]MDR7006072.1 superfamily II DNA or RNA helicase [Paraburkholderia strydomiana]